MWLNGSFSVLGKKAASADVRSCIFGTQLCSVCVAGSSYSPASPSLSKFRSCSSALPCLFLLYWQHFKGLKERGEGNGPLIYFLINPPKCSIKVVWHLENVCCWSVGMYLITSAAGGTRELPPAALLHARSNLTAPVCYQRSWCRETFLFTFVPTLQPSKPCWRNIRVPC